MSNGPYMVFWGDEFYPRGGWNDYEGTFQSLQDALIAIGRGDHDIDCGWWFQIVSIKSASIILSGNRIKDDWELRGDPPLPPPEPPRALEDIAASIGLDEAQAGPSPGLDEFLKDKE